MYRLFLVLALSVITVLAQDKPEAQSSTTFRSDVSLVRVDAHVVDRNNRSIPGLGPEDFVLREGGEQRDVRKVVAETFPIDVILLLDVSRSMEPHVERIASAAHRALQALGNNDRIAIMVFDRSTRVRLPFRNSRQDAERELNNVIDQETFDGGTDITRAMLDATNYMQRNARSDARRAIVILTDDQTERDRNDARVLNALTHADTVMSALIAPDALHTGSTRRMPRDRDSQSFMDDDSVEDMLRSMIPRELAPQIFGPHTRSAGTAAIAHRSGGDSMSVDQGAAFEKTLSRLRERYALYFYLPEGAKPGAERNIEVELSPAARERYPDAQVQYRGSYASPNGSNQPAESDDTDENGSTWL